MKSFVDDLDGCVVACLVCCWIVFVVWLFAFGEFEWLVLLVVWLVV